MVKVHKMFCVDGEVEEFLKGVNASELVNRLLLEHMNKEDLNSMTKEQIQAELKINALKRKTDKEVKELRKNANRY